MDHFSGLCYILTVKARAYINSPNSNLYKSLIVCDKKKATWQGHAIS